MRRKVSHAAAERTTADPIVVAVELTNGTIGYGETLARDYVTGETRASVVVAIERVIAPAIVRFHARSLPDALEALESLPWHDRHGRPIPAARAAVELALLDAVLRTYGRGMDDVVAWMGLPGFGEPGSLTRIRYSGVLAASKPESVLRQLRAMYWGGLRHFKLKVGTPNDRASLERVTRYLRRPIARGRVTLRVDANGSWSLGEADEWLRETSFVPIAGVEQPLPRHSEGDLAELIRRKRVTVGEPASPVGSRSGSRRLDRLLIHDESLLVIDDAHRLIRSGVAGGFNIRISKCGGLIPSLRIAALALRSGVAIQLGCMVGETSILSAAGLRFLSVCPSVLWAEGCFGSFLISGDVVARPLRFGYGGRPPRIDSRGLGVEVDPQRLAALADSSPIVMNL